MGMEIESRVLPGIGVAQELPLHDGRRIGIVTRRNGMRDVVLYDDEGEGALATVSLNEHEANVIAELLGAPQLIVRLADLQEQANSVITEQLPLGPASPFAGRPLGDTQARTRTGVSIVAVLRQGATQPSPGPEFVLHAQDLLVSVGTRDGLDRLARLLDGAG